MFFLEALLPLSITKKHYLFIVSLAEGNNLAQDDDNTFDFLKGRHTVDASPQFIYVYSCSCAAGFIDQQ